MIRDGGKWNWRSTGKIPWHQTMQACIGKWAHLAWNLENAASEGITASMWRAHTEKIDVSIWRQHWAPTEVNRAVDGCALCSVCCNKKLSYQHCGDSVHQRFSRSLGRSRSFEVTDVSTNWKPVCNFQLVNNTILYILSCTTFKLLCSIGQIIPFDKGMSLISALVLGNLCKYCHKSYIAWNWILWTTFLSQTVWVCL